MSDVNPYTPPPLSASGPAETPPQRKYAFRNNDACTYAVLGVQIMQMFAMMFQFYVALVIWSAPADPRGGTPGAANIGYLPILGLVFIFVGLAALLGYGFWFYRTLCNVQALGVPWPARPLLSTLLCFVPLLSALYVPYLLNNIWRAARWHRLPAQGGGWSPIIALYALTSIAIAIIGGIQTFIGVPGTAMELVTWAKYNAATGAVGVFDSAIGLFVFTQLNSLMNDWSNSRA